LYIYTMYSKVKPAPALSSLLSLSPLHSHPAGVKPVIAAPILPSAAANPQAELAGASSKVKQAAEKVGDALPEARKGALAPDVDGQRRKYNAASGAACGIIMLLCHYAPVPGKSLLAVQELLVLALCLRDIVLGLHSGRIDGSLPGAAVDNSGAIVHCTALHCTTLSLKKLQELHCICVKLPCASCITCAM
jgi:hypothetical protein